MSFSTKSRSKLVNELQIIKPYCNFDLTRTNINYDYNYFCNEFQKDLCLYVNENLNYTKI